MKNNFTQQEVLLLTGTRFSSRQWNAKDEPTSGKLTEEQKLEEACWNGLLPEILPELFHEFDGTKMLYLWQVKEAASFLELEMGEFPEEKDNYFSIDPYTFLALRCSN